MGISWIIIQCLLLSSSHIHHYYILKPIPISPEQARNLLHNGSGSGSECTSGYGRQPFAVGDTLEAENGKSGHVNGFLWFSRWFMCASWVLIIEQVETTQNQGIINRDWTKVYELQFEFTSGSCLCLFKIMSVTAN